MKPTSLPFECWLNFSGYLEVAYTKEDADEDYFNYNRKVKYTGQRSWITLDAGQTLIDMRGRRYDPLEMTFMGYWGWKRVADMLPWDYDPDMVKNHY